MDDLLILFAVETQLRNLDSNQDLTILQSKLHSLGNRTKRSKISFNREKCKVLYLDRENTGHYKGKGLEALGGGTWIWSLMELKMRQQSGTYVKRTKSSG